MNFVEIYPHQKRCVRSSTLSFYFLLSLLHFISAYYTELLLYLSFLNFVTFTRPSFAGTQFRLFSILRGVNFPTKLTKNILR